MSVEDSADLIGSHQLITSIESFSESVTQFLLPVIIYVGHKDSGFDALQRLYAGLVHEKKYSGAPAHVVIFDEFPYQLLTGDSVLPSETAYIFRLDDDLDIEPRHVEFLKTRMSVRLINPNNEQMAWHIKSLLLLQDVAYVNDKEFFPSMLSVDSDFRTAVATIILSVVEHRACVVCVNSIEQQCKLQSFLFDMHPSVIRPYTFDILDLDLDRLPSDRVCLATPECNNEQELSELMNSSALNDAIANKPVIVIAANSFVRDTKQQYLVTPIDFPTLESKAIDVQLVAYWCSAYLSHFHDFPMQYSNEQIAEALQLSNYDRNSFQTILLDMAPLLSTPDKLFTKLISQYERLSIDDVFGEAEQRVMLKLRDRSLFVDSASAAAGIPKVTFHKRMKRLGEKQTLIGLLSNEHKID